MQSKKEFILGLFIIIILIVGTYLIVITIWGLLATINDTQKIIIISTIPGLLSILGIFLAENSRRKSEIRYRNHEKRERAYDDFLKIIWRKNKSLKKSSAYEANLIEASRSLVVWASEDVIKEYSEFRKLVQKNKESDAEEKLELITLAIRRDLGQKDSRIAKFDILRLFKNLD